jgi:uncharacterized protein (DUF849 family)
MKDLSKKRIISVAICGAWPTKEDNPNLPVTPEEIADDVYSCWKAGAAIAHVHVRDKDGGPSISTEIYEETVNRIRAFADCDICINMSSSGALGCSDEDRIRPLRRCLPELASYDCGSMNWLHRDVFENHPRFLRNLGLALQTCGIKPELEIFDGGMIYNALHYIKEGVLKPPCHFQFVLGAPGGLASTIENLSFLYSRMPKGEGHTWSACGIGSAHLPIMYTAIAMGGHVRVGMEDNVMWQKGVLAESNAQFVTRAKQLLEIAGYEAATPGEARQILGLARRA